MTFWGFSADANLPGVFLASSTRCDAAHRWPSDRCREVPLMASVPAIAAGTRSVWWQWLLLAVLLLLLLALLAWAVRPYLPRTWNRGSKPRRADRALNLAVRQPVELR